MNGSNPDSTPEKTTSCKLAGKPVAQGSLKGIDKSQDRCAIGLNVGAEFMNGLPILLHGAGLRHIFVTFPQEDFLTLNNLRSKIPVTWGRYWFSYLGGTKKNPSPPKIIRQ